MTTKTEPTGKALTDARLRAGLSLRTAAELLELTPRELGDRQPQPSAPTAESGKAWEPKPGNRCRARVAGRWYEATLREPSAGAPMWLVIIDERGDEIPFGAYWVPTVDLSEPATDASAPTAETDRCDRCAVKLFEMESDVRAANVRANKAESKLAARDGERAQLADAWSRYQRQDISREEFEGTVAGLAQPLDCGTSAREE